MPAPVEPKNLADAFQSLKNDYNAAKPSRFRRKRVGTQSGGSGADYHYRNETDYLSILEQARDMERNDSMINRIVESAVTNTIQGGFQIDPQTGDDALDLDLWNRWQEWANDPYQCDIAGEMAFCDMEFLALRRMLIDGDFFILPTSDGQCQLTESHRVRTPPKTPNVIHGIELGSYRERLAYWITRDDVDPMAAVKLDQSRRIPARDVVNEKQVLQIYDPKRMSQTRGVSALCPIFDMCGMLEDINFAKLVQQQVVSCFAIIRVRQLGFEGNNDDTGYGAQRTERQSDNSSRSISGIGPGMEIKGQPGETLEGFSPNVPNAEYFQQVQMIVRLIAANLGCPPEISLYDTTQTVFHGYRGAVNEAQRGFRHNQQLLIRRMHCPLYRWKLRQWIAEDPAMRAASVRLGKAFYNHKWNPPNWNYIDPSKDADGDSKRLEKNLISPRRWSAERGWDYDELIDEIIADNTSKLTKAIAAAEMIEQQFPDSGVTWRDVLDPSQSKGIAVAQAADPNTDPQQPQPGATNDANA